MRTADRLAILGIMLMALFIRVVPAYDRVITGDRVVFATNDPWIHMRSADNVAAHWPWPSWFDPYRLAPEGQVTDAPLMDIVIAGTALATRIPIDVVGAWFPAVIGALVPLPVFLLCRRLFGRPEAMIAALLVTVLPGQLLQRSLLGHTDHHVAEVLLAVTVLAMLARALESQSSRYAIGAGVFLGLYLLTWSRGVFLAIILLAWALVELLRSEERFKITRVIALTFLPALMIALPVSLQLSSMSLTMPILSGGIAAIAAAEWLLSTIPRRFAPAALTSIAVSGAIVAFIALPDLFVQALRLTPAGGAATVAEVQPLLWPGLSFSLDRVWAEFSTAGMLAVPGLVVFGIAAWRESSPAKRLVLVWSVVVIAATFAQVRFAYYMAVAVAITAAIAATRWLWRGLDPRAAAVIVAAIVIYPSAVKTREIAGAPNAAPSAAWLEALDWVRTSTPEPFNSSSDYFSRYISATEAPVAKYSVMSWWENAWWVSRIARRPPATNPTQTKVKEAARFYLATNLLDAGAILEQRKVGYVIADRSMPMSVETAGSQGASQLDVMVRWSERYETSDFYDVYFERGKPVLVFTADYYQTMAIRLFAYGGHAYTPRRSSWAIATNAQKQIVEKRVFETHEEAEQFVATDPATWRLVGLHPLLSPLPVEPLDIVKREFVSSAGVDGPIGRIPEVAVFKVRLTDP